MQERAFTAGMLLGVSLGAMLMLANLTYVKNQAMETNAAEKCYPLQVESIDYPTGEYTCVKVKDETVP